MIQILQYFAVIFSFVMIYFASLNYKRKEINSIEYIVWVLIWGFVVFVIFFPDPIEKFATTFFFARLFDMMVFGAFILVIIMVAKAYISTRKIENKLEDLVRKLSLKELEEKKKK